jgi:hypothetical protein
MRVWRQKKWRKSPGGVSLSPREQFHTVLSDRCLFGNHCLIRTGMLANGIRLINRCKALSSLCDVTCCLPYLGKSYTVLVWVCFHEWEFGDRKNDVYPKEHSAICPFFFWPLYLLSSYTSVQQVWDELLIFFDFLDIYFTRSKNQIIFFTWNNTWNQNWPMDSTPGPQI